MEVKLANSTEKLTSDFHNSILTGTQNICNGICERSRREGLYETFKITWTIEYELDYVIYFIFFGENEN